jgi:two-component system cell cycle response regulator
VTLRARLTTAFLVMVLGPVVLGAVFVGVMVGKVGEERVSQRVELAASSVRTSLSALCGQLATVAEAVAAAPDEQRLGLAAQFVARGLTSGVHIDHGVDGVTTEAAPPPPWADCSGVSADGDADTVTGYEAITARVSTADGTQVSAAFTADRSLMRRLSGASGAEVTLLAGSGHTPSTKDTREIVGQGVTAGEGVPGAVGEGAVAGATTGEMRAAKGGMRAAKGVDPAPPVHSTLDDAGEVATVANALADGGAGRTAGGDLVRRIGPVAGEPLPVAVSLHVGSPQGTRLMLVLVVLLTALAAVVVAWWLARTATSPLAELAAAADRVAAGDLQTRVGARGKDEIARLGTAFNHMTRELETYVTALTASRDQLRGHLGVLGDTLSSTHDLDRILQVILQTARHATGAAGGIVLLADSTGELVGKCSEGLDGDLSQVRVPIGHGLCGSVAATGVPRLGRIDRDGPLLSKGEPVCRTYMVVPFSAPLLGETTGPGLPPARGVLALYDRLGRTQGCDDFDDQDLMTLRTFAGQAAVAVDNVRVHEEAQRLSVTDSLTGLFNYRSLRDTLRRESERAARFGRKLAVLALDLDHFKDINDRHGHAAGDAVLAEFAQRIRYEIREVDLAFRMGGEEFVVLLPETDEVGGVAVAERLCAAVRETPIAVRDEVNVSVTVSIGIAVLPDHGVAGATVLSAADEALYAAKTAGRDTFRVAGEALLATAGGAPSSPQAPRQAQGR